MIFGLIYLARNIYNKKVYVGATTNHLEVRKHAHVLASKNTKYMELPFSKSFVRSWRRRVVDTLGYIYRGV